jgi:hypothetical protein
VEENESKTKGGRLSGDIAQYFYHLVKERIMVGENTSVRMEIFRQ